MGLSAGALEAVVSVVCVTSDLIGSNEPEVNPEIAGSHRYAGAAPMAAEGKTIVFFPEGAFGPTNNCVGIGEVLKRRGHRVVFVIEESFAGTLEEKGFEERLMRLAPPPEVEEEPGQFWKDFIRDTAPVFRKSTFDQLAEFMAPTWQALIDGARYVDDRLVEIFDELQPDAIVEDNVCAFPAIPASGRPWVRIVSCNPLELKDRELPPPYTGLPLDDSSDWERYRAEYRRAIDEIQGDFSQFCTERGAPQLPAGEMIHESPWLNLYLYPREVDYPRPISLGTDLAQPRVERAHHRCRVVDPLGAGRPERIAHLRQPRLARVRGRAADEGAGRGSGRDPTALHRVEGAPARRVRARREHGRRGVPAAGLGAPAGRPGDHPRRQQHDDRVACTSASR